MLTPARGYGVAGPKHTSSSSAQPVFASRWNDEFDVSLVNYTALAIVLPLIFGIWWWASAKEPLPGPIRTLEGNEITPTERSSTERAEPVEPDFLELELDRCGRLRAYWNGQGWIG